ncbi:hypothetical protein nvc2_017 [Namao virus]|nr:hypothetical protein nvc2_017 [Namao virus]
MDYTLNTYSPVSSPQGSPPLGLMGTSPMQSQFSPYGKTYGTGYGTGYGMSSYGSSYMPQYSPFSTCVTSEPQVVRHALYSDMMTGNAGIMTTSVPLREWEKSGKKKSKKHRCDDTSESSSDSEHEYSDRRVMLVSDHLKNLAIKARSSSDDSDNERRCKKSHKKGHKKSHRKSHPDHRETKSSRVSSRPPALDSDSDNDSKKDIDDLRRHHSSFQKKYGFTEIKKLHKGMYSTKKTKPIIIFVGVGSKDPSSVLVDISSGSMACLTLNPAKYPKDISEYAEECVNSELTGVNSVAAFGNHYYCVEMDVYFVFGRVTKRSHSHSDIKLRNIKAVYDDITDLIKKTVKSDFTQADRVNAVLRILLGQVSREASRQ